jgi:hypothetical protein
MALSTAAKSKLKKIAHFISGTVILLHGYERWETGHSTYPIFITAGIVFLLVALFHHKLLLRFRWIDGVFFMIESSLSFVISFEYFHAGKKALPILWLVAGLLQMAMSIVYSSRRHISQDAEH